MKNKKIALITGGSRGLGRDMAISIAKKEIDVVLTYNSNEAAANEVVKAISSLGQRAKAFQLDTSNIKNFPVFIDDFLVNNAGTGVYGSVTDTTEEAFDSMLNIHFKGVYFLTQKLLPLMADGGAIINISSGLTRQHFPMSQRTPA